jgi:branched-chain amino acid transport system ATP-binding protein
LTRSETEQDTDFDLVAAVRTVLSSGLSLRPENVWYLTSIHAHEREFVSVVGLNGAAKTMLFDTLSGLAPYSGTIRLSGEALRGRTPANIARAGIVQSGIVRRDEAENLDLGGQHLSAQESRERLRWLFDLFPILRERSTQVARTLSGGEQQMLAIARALMMKPRRLILDEPTLGLAPVILEQLSQALETLRRTTSITVLLGEQNVTFALPHADRVYCSGTPVSCGGAPWDDSRPKRAPDIFMGAAARD